MDPILAKDNLDLTRAAPIYLPAAMADVSTLMFRIAVPLRHGSRFEPFGSVRASVAKATSQPPPGESLARTDTQGGIEAGGECNDLADKEDGIAHRRARPSKCLGRQVIFTALQEAASSTQTCCVTSL